MQYETATHVLYSLSFHTYYPGQDCASSPDVDVETTTHKVFPSALAGWDATFAWFNASFGFEPRDVVAILGSHTIGTAHFADSGFVRIVFLLWLCSPLL